MRFTFFTVVSLAGLMFAMEPARESLRDSATLPATGAKKSPTVATTTIAPKDAKSGPTPESTRKRADQPAPEVKRCRPAYLFM